MAGADSIINQRLALSFRIPAVYVVRTHLKLQRRGHTVPSLDSVVLPVLTVGMEIDEAGRYDQAPCIDLVSPSYSLFGDDHDRAAGYPHVANPIETRLRVYYTAVDDHQVGGLPHLLRDDQPAQEVRQMMEVLLRLAV